MIASLKLVEQWVGNSVGVGVGAVGVFLQGDSHELVGMGQGYGAHEDGLDHYEHGGGAAEAEGEREYEGRGIGGYAAKTADGVANILAEALEPEATDGLTGLLDGERDIAELALRGVASIGRGHAAVDVVAGLIFDVGFELLQ